MKHFDAGVACARKALLIATCGIVALGTPAPFPGFDGVRPAAAQAGPPAGEPVTIDTFFDALSPYGEWVEHPDYEYVWIPNEVPGDWRPYTVGQWVWTDDYGWYWESDENFGWAVYHYGRWGYDENYGWFWVPGDEWAPAWVTWREEDGDTDAVVGWAPIAPPAKGYAWGPPPAVQEPAVEQAWVFVPTVRFVEPRVYRYAYPVRETVVYVNRTPRRWYVARDRVYWNRPFDRAYIVRVAPGRPIPVRRVTYVSRPWAAGAARPRDALIVYRPRIDNSRTVIVRRPTKVVRVNEVKRVHVDRRPIATQPGRNDNKGQPTNREIREQEERREQKAKEERQAEKAKQERQDQKAKEERQAEKTKQERQDQKAKEERQAEKTKQERQDQKAKEERQAEKTKQERQDQKAKEERQAEKTKQERQNQKAKEERQDQKAKQDQKANQQQKKANQDQKANQQQKANQDQKAKQQKANQDQKAANKEERKKKNCPEGNNCSK